MGRRRKHQEIRYSKGVRGRVSHDKTELIGEFYGEVNSSGEVYIGKDLKGYPTVTYVFKDGSIEKIVEAGEEITNEQHKELLELIDRKNKLTKRINLLKGNDNKSWEYKASVTEREELENKIKELTTKIKEEESLGNS